MLLQNVDVRELLGVSPDLPSCDERSLLSDEEVRQEAHELALPLAPDAENRLVVGTEGREVVLGDDQARRRRLGELQPVREDA